MHIWFYAFFCKQENLILFCLSLRIYATSNVCNVINLFKGFLFMDDISYSLTVSDVASLLDVSRQAVSQMFKSKSGASKDGKKLTSVSSADIRQFLSTSKLYSRIVRPVLQSS